MGNDYVNPSEWEGWGEQIRQARWKKPALLRARQYIVPRMYKLHKYVTGVACCMDFKIIRKHLYMGNTEVLWNRWVNLMVSEIEMANDRHFGQWAQDQTDNMLREWSLSGLGRFRPTDRRDHIRHEPDTQNLRIDGLATDPLHVL